MAQVVWFKSFLAVAALAVGSFAQAQAVGSFNGSAEAARAFYEDTSAAFAQHYQQTAGVQPQVRRTVADTRGVERGGVVAFNTTTDVQVLADLGVVAGDWAQQFPHDAAPTMSTVLFVVREGNPRNVRDWSDLIRPDVRVVIANPKTCNNGRYAYLGAWGSVREGGGTDVQAAEFVGELYRHAHVVAKSERDAVAAFVQRGEGDVLIAFESDVAALRQAAGAGKVAVVYPSVSVLAENPVALVGSATEGDAGVAKAYLDYLYTDEAQEIAAQHAIRPRSPAVLARHADRFKPIPLFTVARHFGSLRLAQKVHFSEGGWFDQLYQRPQPGALAAVERDRSPS